MFDILRFDTASFLVVLALDPARLFCHAIPVDVDPSAVVRDDVRAGAEDAVFCAYPRTFAHLEGFAQRAEFAPVGAVRELAHHALVVSSLALAELLARVADVGAEVEGAVLEGRCFVHRFGFSLIGLAALDLGEHEALFAVFHREGGIVTAEDGEARALAAVFGRGPEGHLDGDGLCGSCGLLEEHVGHVSEVLVGVRDGVGVEAQEAAVAGAVGPLLIVVGLPLPLQSEGHAVELVAFLRGADGVFLADVGFLVCQDGVAAAVAVVVDADDGPVIDPAHGLQVDEASVCADVLEVEKPVFARRGVDPCSLVRAVDGTLALGEHDAVFIRAVDVLRALDGLETGRYASCGVEDVVVAAPFVEFRSFARALPFVAVEDDA